MIDPLYAHYMQMRSLLYLFDTTSVLTQKPIVQQEHYVHLEPQPFKLTEEMTQYSSAAVVAHKLSQYVVMRSTVNLAEDISCWMVDLCDDIDSVDERISLI